MMKTILGNRKGITLIEVLISVALLGIILYPVSSYILNNMIVFNHANDQIEVQGEIKAAMNELVERIMEMKRIEAIKDTGGANVDLASTERKSISQIVFYDVLHKSTPESMYLYICHLDSDADSIRDSMYTSGEGEINKLLDFGTADSKVADRISEIFIEPIGGSYNSCRGLKLTIAASKNKTRVELSNDVFFRNLDTE